MNTIGLRVNAVQTPLVRKAAALLAREIRERSGVEAREAPERDADIVLDIAPGGGTEGFRVEDAAPRGVRVVGHDERGLLYGVGKLLRSSRFESGRFTPGSWRGVSVPKNPVRGMYFATHFHNFYHDAPIERVERYVEDLALWGCNALSVWFDMHHYKGIRDPEAQEMIRRLHAILKAANGVGMGAGLTTLANEAYAGSPEDLRSDPQTGRAHYRVELCPSKPEGRKLMLRWRQEMVEAFRDVRVEYFWIWPYDQGGCACAKCAPWGANGFLRIGEDVARLVRQQFSEAKIILSTWLFDYKADEGEWSGLSRAFTPRPDWVDYLMADSHGKFPAYLLKHAPPGGLPVINFPEISMFGCGVWGGWGANPAPRRFQSFWDSSKRLLSGGFPYSEGIFEDINKAITLQFYWDPDRPAEEAVKEYAAYEYAPVAAQDIAKAVAMMEHGNDHWMGKIDEIRTEAAGGPFAQPPVLYALPQNETADDCLDIVRGVEPLLTEPARRSWRWRILRLRATLDQELRKTGGRPSEASEAAFEELTSIYAADRAEPPVAPPGRRALARFYGRPFDLIPLYVG
jgi:hypothetical protein